MPKGTGGVMNAEHPLARYRVEGNPLPRDGGRDRGLRGGSRRSRIPMLLKRPTAAARRVSSGTQRIDFSRPR